MKSKLISLSSVSLLLELVELCRPRGGSGSSFRSLRLQEPVPAFPGGGPSSGAESESEEPVDSSVAFDSNSLLPAECKLSWSLDWSLEASRTVG